MLYWLPFEPLNSGSLFSSPECRNETWLESMPPSIACSQLHSCRRFDMKLWLGRHHGEFPLRQRRLLLRRAHVGPQHAAALDQRIGLQLDLLAEAALGRLRRHLDALAGVVVFPAVIGAAQPAVLVAAEPQRDAAVGAELVGQRELPCVSRQASSRSRQELDAHRRALVLGQLLGQQRRLPAQAEHLAHRRAGAGLGEKVVLFFAEHRSLPGSSWPF